jgi:hypothetical protein
VQSLLIWDSGAPDIHVSLVTDRGQGPTLVVAEAGGSAPERSGEHITTVEAAGQSGAAPQLAGSKRVAPEKGSLSRPTKKSGVRSKM